MEGSGLTVLLAGAANLFIAVAKLVAGIVTGSSSMLSEAAHSFADTLNEVFLLTAVRRSSRPADAEHPFGYGMERYFWSLLAAVSIFVLGAGFSVFQGISALVSPHEQERIGIALGVLAFAFLLDGMSFLRAMWQVRAEAVEAESGVLRHLLHDAEPAVRAVVFEDLVALIGVCLAGGGLLLDRAFGSTAYDAAASIAIGVLLLGVAGVLGRQNKQLLIGRAVDPEDLRKMGEEIVRLPGIDRVVQLLTMQLGPDEVLLAARVEVSSGTSAVDLASVADETDARLRERFPEIRHVFLDPTPTED